jgi:hypothetical protein
MSSGRFGNLIQGLELGRLVGMGGSVHPAIPVAGPKQNGVLVREPRVGFEMDLKFENSAPADQAKTSSTGLPLWATVKGRLLGL